MGSKHPNQKTVLPKSQNLFFYFTGSDPNYVIDSFLDILVAGWPGLDKGTLFLVLHVWNSDAHHSLSLQEISSFPKNRQEILCWTHTTNSTPQHPVTGTVIRTTFKFFAFFATLAALATKILKAHAHMSCCRYTEFMQHV